MTELEAYRELVSQKANENSTEMLPNAGKEHASIVMSKMFEKTTTSVKMIVGSFDGSVSDNDEYLRELEKCINKNIPIKIIFLENPNIRSRAYNLLLEKQKDGKNIEFRKATEEIISILKQNNKTFHISLFDKNKYRYEEDIKKYSAWFCFNDEINAERFNALFDIAYSFSTRL